MLVWGLLYGGPWLGCARSGGRLGSNGTVWNQTGNGFFCVCGFLFCLFVFRLIYLSVNAQIPYTAGKTTRISWPSFITPIILHSFIMFFVNFLLETNSPIPFRFSIYATSKHFSEFFIPFTCQLSGDGVRRVVVILQAVKPSSFSATAAVLIAVSTDHWGTDPQTSKNLSLMTYCFKEGNRTSMFSP